MTLVYFAAAWLLGIAIADALRLSGHWSAGLAAGAFLALLLLRKMPHRGRWLRLGASCLLCFGLGGTRLALSTPRFDTHSLATYNDRGSFVLEGIVSDEPDEREYFTYLRIRAERLWFPDGPEIPVRGMALVQTARYPRFAYGDRVQAIGSLEMPPEGGEFSYRDYLARQGVHSYMPRAQVLLVAPRQGHWFMQMLLDLKRRAQQTIAAILPEPQAALLTGILLGVESGIPSDLLDSFRATGTSHILAISGFNLTLVAGVLMRLGRRMLGPRRSWWVAGVGVALYTILVGASAAVLRAALMAFLCLWARYLGRPSYGPTALAAAAVLMTAWNPNFLWDVGFQLSFTATAGLVLFADPLERTFVRLFSRVTSNTVIQSMVKLLQETTIVGWAAQIAALPVILTHFGQLSLVSPFTNLLVLPVQPAVMTWGGMAALLGMIARPLGQAFGWVAWAFLTYTIECVELTARMPYASVYFRAPGGIVWLYYILLGVLSWWITRSGGTERTRLKLQLQERLQRMAKLVRRLTLSSLLGILLLLAMVCFSVWRTIPDGNLHITFLDVGQGDAIFIRTPSGRQVLIDGGPADRPLLRNLGCRMPFWDRTLDLVVLTHPDTDHLVGLLAVLERYRVEAIVFHPVLTETPWYAQWESSIKDETSRVYPLSTQGLRIIFGDGTELEIWPPEPISVPANLNDASLVSRIAYGGFSVLLPGDISAEMERILLARGYPLRSVVLKVAHHGSCTSTSEEFLHAIEPQLAVVSVGENRFGHPCSDVLERLKDRPVYRTDKHGSIEVITDGKLLWVVTER